jgi:hypothetical protein
MRHLTRTSYKLITWASTKEENVIYTASDSQSSCLIPLKITHLSQAPYPHDQLYIKTSESLILLLKKVSIIRIYSTYWSILFTKNKNFYHENGRLIFKSFVSYVFFFLLIAKFCLFLWYRWCYYQRSQFHYSCKTSYSKINSIESTHCIRIKYMHAWIR